MAKPAIYYDNRFTDAAVRASSTAAGYAVANVTDWRPYTWWKANAADATLTVNCGAAASADYGLVIGHNLGSQGATITWQSSADGSSWTTRGTASPTDDGHLLTTFASVSAQYWRASISGAPGAAAIDWRFAADKALPDAVAFTRASTATYFDADGVLRTAAVNEPRFDHDPETGESLGLLVEEARTNLVTYSAITNANWNDNVNGLITDTGVTAPDGSTSIRLTAAATVSGTQVRAISQNHALASGAVYTHSVCVRAGDMRYAFLISAGTAYTGTDPSIFFDFDTGTITSSSATVSSSSVKALGGGWFRISMVAAATDAAANEQLMIGHSSTNGVQTHNATAGEYTFFWGAQVELGTFPTSYIPTTSATVTRSADVASVTGTDFSGFYNQSTGTVLITYKAGGDTDGNSIMGISDGTANELIEIGHANSGNTVGNYLAVVDGGASQATTPTGSTATAYESRRFAAAYAVNDFAVSREGGTVSTDASGTLPTVDRLHIGHRNSARQFGGQISRLSYWPTRLTNTQLQWLSAAERPVFANPTIAIAAVGAALELPTWLPQGFDPTGRQVESSVNRNANGQPLGRIIDYERWQQTITQQSIPWAWIRSTFDPAWSAHLRSSPFAFCWEPSSYADEVRLVVAGDRVDTPHRSGLLADLSLDVFGVLE